MKKYLVPAIILITVLAFYFVAIQRDNTVGATVLTVRQGGTGATSFTAGECLIGAGTGAVTTGACGEAGSFTQAIASTTFVSRSDWTTIDNYPNACSAYQFMTGIGDTLACTTTPVSQSSARYGAYYTDSDTIVGTSTLYFADNKNIGIGTTVPAYAVDVNGIVQATYFYGDGSQLTNVGAAAPSSLTFSGKAAVALKKGQAVYISGGNSAQPTLALADNTDAVKSRVVGLVVADANENATVLIRRAGTLTLVDTDGATYANPGDEDWDAGQLLFLTTGGGLTETRPTSGRSVKVAYSLNGDDNTDTLLAYPMENPVWVTAAANEDVVLRLGDDVGVEKVSIRNYSNAEKAYVNSLGNALFVNASTTQLTATVSYLGTIMSGTWNGTAIGVTYGGTGLTSVTGGSLLYASAANTWAALASSTDNYYLAINANGFPVWQALDGEDIAADTIDDDSIDFSDVTCADLTMTDCGNITTTGTVDFGGASLEITNGASPTVDGIGEIAVDSTSDQFAYYGASKRILVYDKDQTVTIASSTWNSTAGPTATSSIPLGVVIRPETWFNFRCFTDTGTAIIRFATSSTYVATTPSMAVASSTAGNIDISWSLSAGDKRYITIGNTASTPNFVTCSIRKSFQSD